MNPPLLFSSLFLMISCGAGPDHYAYSGPVYVVPGVGL